MFLATQSFGWLSAGRGLKLKYSKGLLVLREVTSSQKSNSIYYPGLSDF